MFEDLFEQWLIYMQDKGDAVSNLFLLEHVLGNHYHRFFFNSQRIWGECIMYIDNACVLPI